MLLSRDKPHLGRCATHRRFNGIERGDLSNGSFRDRGFRVAHELYESTAQVTPAMHQHPWSLRSFDTRQPTITLIAVALQESPAEALQESFGMFAASPRRVAEQHDGRTSADMSAIIGSNRPKEPFLCLPAPRIEDRRRGFIHEETIRCRQMRTHALGDRFQMEAGSACPITQCRAIQMNALAGVNLGLPVERQVIAELRDDDLSDQRLGRQATEALIAQII